MKTDKAITVEPASIREAGIITELIVASDIYIYSPLDDGGRQANVEFFARCLGESANVFFSEHVLTARINGNIAGIAVVLPTGGPLAFDGNGVTNGLPQAGSIAYVSRGYFDELLEELAEMKGTYLNNMAVLPEYRRCGAARSLLEYIKVNYSLPITLDVLSNNPSAFAAYRQAGFVETERFDAYSGRFSERLTCIRMQFEGVGSG